MSVEISLLIALGLDYVFQEPKRFHPLVGFGNLVAWLEARLNPSLDPPLNPSSRQGENGERGSWTIRLKGVVAWSIAVLPLCVLAFGVSCWLSSLEGMAWLHTIVGGVVLYLAIGWQSLLTHAYAISSPLKGGDIDQARSAVGMIVSRDTRELDERAVASAATESVLENGADAIFAAIFWFCLFGIPAVVLYRLSNTLDAMWGYKNPRFLHFGWCAARMDDLLNYVPARLCALSYALVGQTATALQSWRKQAATWKSPNAGPVMSAGAGAINVTLGGAAVYHGQLQTRPPLGPEDGEAPSAHSIELACHLVNRTLWLWVAILMVLPVVCWLMAVI